MLAAEELMWKLHGGETFSCSDIGEECRFPAELELSFTGGALERNGGDFANGVVEGEVPQNHIWTPSQGPFSESITVKPGRSFFGEQLLLVDWCREAMRDSHCSVICGGVCECQPDLTGNEQGCDLVLKEDHDECTDAKHFTVRDLPYSNSGLTL
jgi:hypothetical protein